MNRFLIALLLFLAPACQTFSGGADAPPAGPQDEVYFEALVLHGAELAAGQDLAKAEELEWVEIMATVYAVLRFNQGNPVMPLEGESPTGAAIREALEEMRGDGADILYEKDWALRTVRLYAAWRFADGDPIPLN